MFDTKLQNFLNKNGACLGGITRLQDIGVETLEQAWDRASDKDLIWAVTQRGVMNPEQRRLFLVMVLSSIEDKLTDRRSKNILEKLRTNEVITNEDQAAASDAMSDAAWAAAMAAAMAAAWAAAWAAQAKWVRENFNLCDLHTK